MSKWENPSGVGGGCGRGNYIPQPLITETWKYIQHPPAKHQLYQQLICRFLNSLQTNKHRIGAEEAHNANILFTIHITSLNYWPVRHKRPLHLSSDGPRAQHGTGAGNGANMFHPKIHLCVHIMCAVVGTKSFSRLGFYSTHLTSDRLIHDSHLFYVFMVSENVFLSKNSSSVQKVSSLSHTYRTTDLM